MNKYIKVMFGNKGVDYEYKIDEVNVANVWNPEAKSGKEFGGFNFTTPEKLLRWLHRGDTIYDVIIPDDAIVIDVKDSATPHGVFRSDKIILTNPRKVTDDIALEFYKISTIPEEAYPNALGAVAVMNYFKTAKTILKDKVNKDNINFYLSEWNDFTSKHNRKNCNDTVIYIDKELNRISKG